MRTNDYERIEKAILYLESNWKRQPELEELAQAAGLSPFHFQRLFQRWAGVSPKRFLQYLTAEFAKKRLRESQSILDASYDAGLSGPGRLHDLFISVEAMTPGEYKALGQGLRVEYGVHPTPFGEALAAVTSRGLCGFLFLGQGGEKSALSQLKRHWPKADFVSNPVATGDVVQKIFQPTHSKKNLKVLLKGTPFQVKVWEALLRIPAGCVTSYGDLAEKIGKPKASRAVGSAVGQNNIAYLIPCHRVIRETGVLGDYRWGSARKKALLGWEQSQTSTVNSELKPISR
jgi:AraC family transcriptional regulator, regulatory protein of adaptative response / methylated-DNA-[protein]-cysteine methyltransferase